MSKFCGAQALAYALALLGVGELRAAMDLSSYLMMELDRNSTELGRSLASLPKLPSQDSLERDVAMLAKLLAGSRTKAANKQKDCSDKKDKKLNKATADLEGSSKDVDCVDHSLLAELKKKELQRKFEEQLADSTLSETQKEEARQFFSSNTEQTASLFDHYLGQSTGVAVEGVSVADFFSGLQDDSLKQHLTKVYNNIATESNDLLQNEKAQSDAELLLASQYNPERFISEKDIREYLGQDEAYTVAAIDPKSASDASSDLGAEELIRLPRYSRGGGIVENLPSSDETENTGDKEHADGTTTSGDVENHTASSLGAADTPPVDTKIDEVENVPQDKAPPKVQPHQDTQPATDSRNNGMAFQSQQEPTKVASASGHDPGKTGAGLVSYKNSQADEKWMLKSGQGQNGDGFAPVASTHTQKQAPIYGAAPPRPDIPKLDMDHNLFDEIIGTGAGNEALYNPVEKPSTPTGRAEQKPAPVASGAMPPVGGDLGRGKKEITPSESVPTCSDTQYPVLRAAIVNDYSQDLCQKAKEKLPGDLFGVCVQRLEKDFGVKLSSVSGLQKGIQSCQEDGSLLLQAIANFRARGTELRDALKNEAREQFLARTQADVTRFMNLAQDGNKVCPTFIQDESAHPHLREQNTQKLNALAAVFNTLGREHEIYADQTNCEFCSGKTSSWKNYIELAGGKKLSGIQQDNGLISGEGVENQFVAYVQRCMQANNNGGLSAVVNNLGEMLQPLFKQCLKGEHPQVTQKLREDIYFSSLVARPGANMSRDKLCASIHRSFTWAVALKVPDYNFYKLSGHEVVFSAPTDVFSSGNSNYAQGVH